MRPGPLDRITRLDRAILRSHVAGRKDADRNSTFSSGMPSRILIGATSAKTSNAGP